MRIPLLLYVWIAPLLSAPDCGYPPPLLCRNTAPPTVAYSHRIDKVRWVSRGLGMDAAGNVYVAGGTSSSDFPTTAGVFQPVFGGGLCDRGPFFDPWSCPDVVVQKRSPSGEVLYSTYLGGSGEDYPVAITADAAGNAYVIGLTSSKDLSAARAGIWPPSSDPPNWFLAVISPDGHSLQLTYVPASELRALAVDGEGSVYVTGRGGYQSSNTHLGGPTNESIGVWVAKLNPSRNILHYAILFGSGEPNAIAVDRDGSAYVAGGTSSPDFPVTEAAFQKTSHPGEYYNAFEGFVVKINPAGTRLEYSTYLGGSGPDQVNAIAVDVLGQAYVAGAAGGDDFPVTEDAFQRIPGGGDPVTGKSDAFVAKLNTTGSALVYSTFLGGYHLDEANTILLQPSGSIYVAGGTDALDFPVVRPMQASNRGYREAFLAKLNPSGSALEMATYFGGGSMDDGLGLAAGPGGRLYLWGTTWSMDFPSTYPPAHLDSEVFLACLLPEESSAPLVFQTGVLSAASFQMEVELPDWAVPVVAPGELITIFGVGIGPSPPALLQLYETGKVAKELGDTMVMIDGVPAPVLYAGATQVNAVVPYAVGGRMTVKLEVLHRGVPSNAVEVKVAEALPAMFTLEPWGRGQAAVLNEDGSINSWDRPAREGSVIAIYATGAGVLEPVPVDGELSAAPYARIPYPVSVVIGGTPAEVLYAGAAPGLVSGVIQINARLGPGTAGDWKYQAGIGLRIGDRYSNFVASIVVE